VTALRLAALRARRSDPHTNDRESLDQRSRLLGRSVTVADGALALGSDPDRPLDPDSLGISIRKLAPNPSVILAVTIGLCWVDRDDHPYPGQVIPEQAVLDAYGSLGGRPSPHTSGALRNVLSATGLLMCADRMVRLGPAIASWGESDIAALRRIEHVLPAPFEGGARWEPPAPPLAASPLTGPAPTGDRLGLLSARDREHVLDALAAVECADEPVAASRFPALADPALKSVVVDCLGVAGRCLVQHPGDTWLSGYRDGIAERLAEEGIGVLRPADAAVLTLVLLHSVAIPRASGRAGSDRWSDGQPVAPEELAKNRSLSGGQIQASVRRLRDAGILRPGHRAEIVPGPQFDRLTPAQSGRLWEDLIVTTKPESPEARRILFRRGEIT